MFLENIEEADFSSEKLENHFEEVSDSLLDIQNEVDFQRLVLVWVGYWMFINFKCIPWIDGNA